MRGHIGHRLKSLYSWVIAGTLTLVLATTAVAVMARTPQPPTPLSEPVSSHATTPTTSATPSSEAPTTEAPTTEVPTTLAPTTVPTAPSTTLAPVPTTVTYTYGGDDSESYGSSGGSYGAGGSAGPTTSVYGGDD
jgi:cytoskeletal protein RodZ